MMRFILGFLVGCLLFVFINLASAHLSSDCGLAAVFGWDFCADDIARAGWPLRFYEAGGFDNRNVMQMGILALDILFGIGFAGTIGWLYARRVK